jgi:hypothetical protein
VRLLRQTIIYKRGSYRVDRGGNRRVRG